MSLIHNAVSFAFPFIEGTDPMILAPVLALVLSFSLVGLFGLVMMVHDFVSTQK
ncbi:MAG: hypothetical protein GY747_02785 [Planctomycetes bacterium]|nr:hypothetical protein [Planctomycetota bacterium]MCP4770173.1 hypothetical protein [Planctomycetota bacterium]MCP4860679.1 hypothetical protein [Planctomycetota bacterium]